MSEHDEQSIVFQWAERSQARFPELALLYAIPNGAKLPWRKNSAGQRYSPEAVRLKREGLKSGVPDICLPVPRAPFHGLYVELKHGKNKTSQQQDEWIVRLIEQGYCALVAHEAEHAIAIITAYLEGRLI